MKIPRTLIACSLVAAAAVPAFAGSAGAVDTTELTVVDGYSYSAENPMAATICLDDTLVQSGEAVINPPIETTPGDHIVKVVQSAGEDCTDDTVDWTETPVTLHDVAAQTLAIGWMNYDGQIPVNDTWIFDDSQACLPDGEARIVYRNVATDFELLASLGSDAVGTTDISGAAALISDVAQGDEASADVDAGTFPADDAERLFGWGTRDTTPFVGSDVQIPVPAGTIAYVYAYSGNDGPVGLAVTTRDVGVCGAAVTTTSSTTSTTRPAATSTAAPSVAGAAAPATPVAARPTYTG